MAPQQQPVRDFDVLRAALTGLATLAIIDAPWTPIYVAIAFIIHPWLGVLATLGGVALVALKATTPLPRKHS